MRRRCDGWSCLNRKNNYVLLFSWYAYFTHAMRIQLNRDRYMKRILTRVLFVGLVLLVSCVQEDLVSVPKPPEEVSLDDSFYYEINLNDRSDDTFKVRLYVKGLQDDNNIFQFPATVPGTYSISDIGRFVRSFKAYDDRYQEIPTAKVSTGANQWIITHPEKAYLIEYTIAETFDNPVTENSIYPMAGTSMEDDHVLLNTFDVLGYPTGLSKRKFYLKLWYPTEWTIGTSLEKTPGGLYVAKDYDYLVDSPLLIGKITTSSTQVSGADVRVYAYSKSDLISASEIQSDLNQMLLDAEQFLNGLPVDRYSFIYFFENPNAGALEHSFSSVYALRDQSHTEQYGRFLKRIAAHEFFHVVTPLNIHSEIIENFNFATPTPSQHLWLYEGVTEWASYMMQYRNGSMNFDDLAYNLRLKILNVQAYSADYSLTDIALTCYTPNGGRQYGNIYQKGALVALLLDIRLLELSGGKYGLRELLLDLIDTYGKENAFSETGFFGDLVAITGYPEIESFINQYIKGKEPLPLEEYFAKLGIQYTEEAGGVYLSLIPQPSQVQHQLFESWSKNLD